MPKYALRCISVYPCVPLCTPRLSSKMLDNTPQSGGKYSEIPGNARKSLEILVTKLGNTRKSSEILGKKGSCLCASLHPC
jgi:hypothetical protein